MTIYEVNKILSSENKSKLIAHFWFCNCNDHDVSHMTKKLNVSQSNLSKHIGMLLKLGVLTYKQVGKNRFYSINKKWKNNWVNIVESQVLAYPNYDFICSCSCVNNENFHKHNDKHNCK